MKFRQLKFHLSFNTQAAIGILFMSETTNMVPECCKMPGK